jgi:hypothetical protein
LAALSLTFGSSSSLSSTSLSPTSGGKNPASPADHSPHAESTPRGLSDIFSLFKRDKQAVWWGVQESEEIRKLDNLLADREIRNEIVMDLLASHSEYVLPLRFITSFSEYSHTHDRKERHLKGKKIISMFFNPSSAFHLKSIPEDDLSQVKIEHLGMVKVYFLAEMVKVPLIIEYLANHSDPASESKVDLEPSPASSSYITIESMTSQN